MLGNFNSSFTEVFGINHVQDDIMKKYGVDRNCAQDIEYLRTRARHTEELENELIALHKAGTPPNMMEFGVTHHTHAAMEKFLRGVKSSVNTKG